LSGSLIWEPQVDQEELLSVTPKPVYDDILIAKLRPGQVLTFFCLL
jgi:hypothetical protein